MLDSCVVDGENLCAVLHFVYQNECIMVSLHLMTPDFEFGKNLPL
jgi:hypothetical protein